MKKSKLLSILIGIIMTCWLQAAPPAGDANMNAFVNDLMNRMTLEEKIGQLNLLSVGFDVTGPVLSKDVDTKIRQGLVGGVFNTYTPEAVRKLQALAVNKSRWGIPLLFGYDVIHGHKTVFPIPLGLSCTWNLDSVERSARIAATEASADGVNWTFSPMVDIARDPRWGRIAEGAGEDPYLGAQIAQAMVRGYQGDDLSRSNALMACVKHFALYGAAEAGRDYNTVDMSRLKMYQYYLPPYRAAVEAGAGSVMCSFNEINGVPASANHWLLSDLLRTQWGFQGFVVTDYAAISELSEHGMGDLRKDAELALKAGVDMDMVSETYLNYLPELAAHGEISESMINQACRRILEAKYKLGLFADPYHGCTEERARAEILTPENRKAAREIAEQSFVLLKNNRQLLPLRKSGVIALVGPLADDRQNLLGCCRAAGDWQQAVSIRTGISNVAGPAVTTLHAKGANLTDDPMLRATLKAFGEEIPVDRRSPREMVAEAVAVAARADVVVAVLGESSSMSGEATSRSDIGLPECQKDLLQALVETGKPLVLVLMNGRPLTLTWEAEHCGAILETWFGGTEAGNAIADVLFGDYNPSGKLTATFPRNVGQIPIYYNHKNTGRPYKDNPGAKYVSRYLDVPNDPLYPFGYGLSYTTFAYGDVKLSQTNLIGDKVLLASVDVTNTGERAGEETVQLYLSQPAASVTRSVEDLRGFEKVHLQPGESKEVTFRITPEDLKFYNGNLEYDWEPGEFMVRIGGNSSQLKSATVNWSKVTDAAKTQ
ncbi:MAG TPA: beta-glucosidase BglX [Candidatus Limnocylindrales bacterium]|nr:beta-glucosidase BglX [Candidatus Limnocylindrales bacterium]